MAREVKFTAERFPPEAAEQLLSMPREEWATAAITKDLDGNGARNALSLAPDDLQGSVWRKGGAKPGRRFGSVKAVRLGSAALRLHSLKLVYTVKTQRLVGTGLLTLADSSGSFGSCGDSSDY